MKFLRCTLSRKELLVLDIISWHKDLQRSSSKLELSWASIPIFVIIIFASTKSQNLSIWLSQILKLWLLEKISFRTRSFQNILKLQKVLDKGPKQDTWKTLEASCYPRDKSTLSKLTNRVHINKLTLWKRWMLESLIKIQMEMDYGWASRIREETLEEIHLKEALVQHQFLMAAKTKIKKVEMITKAITNWFRVKLV